MEYPFAQFRSAVLAMSPPKFLPTPGLLAFGGATGDTALMLCKHCSETAKTLVCYLQIQITALYGLLQAKLTPV